MQLIEQPSSRVARTAAFKRFGSFKKEEEHAIRQLDVNGDELHRLRQRREALRHMTPEQAIQVIEFHKGLNIFEAIALAKSEGKIIVPNIVIDRILTETGAGALLGNPPVWTGTCVIYEARNTPFGERVTYAAMDRSGLHALSTLSFDVPSQFRGKMNCALVVEHPDYDFISVANDKFELKADKQRISLLENFPPYDSGFDYALTPLWFSPDEKYRIPVGDSKEENGALRCIRRTLSYSNFIGLACRNNLGLGEFIIRRRVSLSCDPSESFDVALF